MQFVRSKLSAISYVECANKTGRRRQNNARVTFLCRPIKLKCQLLYGLLRSPRTAILSYINKQCCAQYHSSLLEYGGSCTLARRLAQSLLGFVSFICSPNGAELKCVFFFVHWLRRAVSVALSVWLIYRQCWWMHRQDVNWIIFNIIYVTHCARARVQTFCFSFSSFDWWCDRMCATEITVFRFAAVAKSTKVPTERMNKEKLWQENLGACAAYRWCIKFSNKSTCCLWHTQPIDSMTSQDDLIHYLKFVSNQSNSDKLRKIFYNGRT